MELNRFQDLIDDQTPDPKIAHTQLRARFEIGTMARVLGTMLEEDCWASRNDPAERPDRQTTVKSLGTLMAGLARLARHHDIYIQEVATTHLSKMARQAERQEREKPSRQLFDAGYPENEQIPRLMAVKIVTERNGQAMTTINGRKFGDPLTDNRYRYEDDGYRYHDVFHICHAAILGWSPTLRGLLRRKRKSNAEIDEVEDGGRAIVIEEGITAMVFSHAEQRNFLDGIQKLDHDLLRTIRGMTKHLEVSARTECEWEHAILTGYRIWRGIRQDKGGSFTANLLTSTVSTEQTRISQPETG